MTRSTEERISNYINSSGGYAKSDDLREQGFHSKQLSSLVESGLLRRLKRGLYVLSKDNHRSELADIQRAIPRGIFCLGTALSLHRIGTWIPADYHIALPRDYRISVPESPPIRLYSFSGSRFESGVMELVTPSGSIRVYDQEKTICDIVRFRNTLGLDIVKEALHDYLAKPEKNLPKLLEYARILRTEGMIRAYLDLFA